MALIFNNDLLKETAETNLAMGGADLGRSFATKGGGGLDLSSFAKLGTGAITGLVGTIADNQAIKSRNKSIDKSVDLMNKRIAELKKERIETTESAKGEAQDFLLSYVTIKDANKASQIASMANQARRSYLAEKQGIDNQITGVTNQMATLEAQKEEEAGVGSLLLGGISGLAMTAPLL